MWGVLQPPSPEVLSLRLEMYHIATSHRKRWIPLSSSAVCWPLMCLCASRPGTRSLFWKPFQHHVVLPHDIQQSSPQPFHSLHGVFVCPISWRCFPYPIPCLSHSALCLFWLHLFLMLYPTTTCTWYPGTGNDFTWGTKLLRERFGDVISSLVCKMSHFVKS